MGNRRAPRRGGAVASLVRRPAPQLTLSPAEPWDQAAIRRLMTDGHTVARLKHGDDVAVMRAGSDADDRATARVAVQHVFDQMGERSRYLRFRSPTRDISDTMVGRLVDPPRDHERELVTVSALPLGLTAEEVPAGVEPGHAIAFGTLVRDLEDPETAEVDLAVADSWQGRGVGTLLAESLALQAESSGVRRLTAQLVAGNTGARRLLQHMAEGGEYSQAPVSYGCQDIVVSLPEPR